MTKEVYKKLSEWNPKKGDVFQLEDSNIKMYITSDTHFRADYWNTNQLDEVFNFWDHMECKLVSRATPEETPVGKWVGWNGGECPVHPKTIIEIVGGFDDSYTSVACPDEVIWENVSAYRIITPYKESKEYWVSEDRHGNLHVTKEFRHNATHVRKVEEDNV